MLKSNKKLFNKICYGVFKCNDLKLLNVAKKRVSKISSKFGFKFNPGSFSKVSAEKLNNYMKNVNKELEPLSIDIINSFSKTIKLFFGNKIAIQKKPYIRINCKHLINTATIPHADFDFGHSPVGYNIWVPLFDVFGKSGIYVYSLSESKLIYKNFKFNKRLDEHINTIKKKKENNEKD